MPYEELFNQSQQHAKSLLLTACKATKSNFKDAAPVSFFNFKIYALFTYDAETLIDLEASTSIFTCYQYDLFKPSIFNEHFANDENRKFKSIVKNQETFDIDQSGINRLNMTEFITFSTLVKEQSPTNNLDTEAVEKLVQSDIYASKYYPQRIKYTVQGRILHLEARIKLPVSAEHRHELLQLIIFVESSPITIDQITWASELKQTTINGAGIGFNWTYKDSFAFQAYFASELEGQVLAISPALSNLYWIQAVNFF